MEFEKEIISILDNACLIIANDKNLSDNRKEYLIDLISNVQNEIED